MAVLRRLNLLGNQRLDLPHVRLIESAVAGDFDALGGGVLTGHRPVIVSGFTVPSAFKTGSPAEDLVMIVSGATALLPTASESGTVISVPVGTYDETLGHGNPNVSGSFAVGTTNYVGIDLIRSPDASTVAPARFRATDTSAEFTQQIPTSIGLKYVITIDTNDFSQRPTVAPIATVVTDASGNVVSITDCRDLLFRLGTGGSTPSALAVFDWVNRDEATSGDAFVGGDKGIASQYDFNRAIMTRLWELGGGEHWYSDTADRTMHLVGDPAQKISAELGNITWDGTDVTWQGLSVVFGGSTVWFNTINDQGAPSAGLTDLADGECLYVDIDRTQAATLTVAKGALATLGSPAVPGSRIVLAWRKGSGVVFKDRDLSSGNVLDPATTGNLGGVFLESSNGAELLTPKVPVTGTVGPGGKRLLFSLGATSYNANNTVELFNMTNDKYVVMGGSADTVTIGKAGKSVVLNGTTTLSAVTSGAISAASLNVTGAISADSGTITNALSVGSLSATSATVGSTFGTLTSTTLTVNGAFVAKATATFGHIIIDAVHDTIAGGALTPASVAASGAVSGLTVTAENLIKGGSFETTGSATVGALTASSATVNADITVKGDTTTVGTAKSKTLTVTENASVTGTATVGGNVVAAGAGATPSLSGVSGRVHGRTLSVSSDASVDGKLTVAGATTLAALSAGDITADSFAWSQNTTRTAWADISQMTFYQVKDGNGLITQCPPYQVSGNAITNTTANMPILEVRIRFYIMRGGLVGSTHTGISIGCQTSGSSAISGKLYRMLAGTASAPPSFMFPVADVSCIPQSTQAWMNCTISNWQTLPAAQVEGPYFLVVGLPSLTNIYGAFMTYTCPKVDVLI